MSVKSSGLKEKAAAKAQALNAATEKLLVDPKEIVRANESAIIQKAADLADSNLKRKKKPEDSEGEVALEAEVTEEAIAYEGEALEGGELVQLAQAGTTANDAGGALAGGLTGGQILAGALVIGGIAAAANSSSSGGGSAPTDGSGTTPGGGEGTPGDTFRLTTERDGPDSDYDKQIVGTENDDIFDGSLEFIQEFYRDDHPQFPGQPKKELAALMTLTAGDFIDGDDGYDTLIVGVRDQSDWFALTFNSDPENASDENVTIVSIEKLVINALGDFSPYNEGENGAPMDLTAFDSDLVRLEIYAEGEIDLDRNSPNDGSLISYSLESVKLVAKGEGDYLYFDMFEQYDGEGAPLGNLSQLQSIYLESQGGDVYLEWVGFEGSYEPGGSGSAETQLFSVESNLFLVGSYTTGNNQGQGAGGGQTKYKIDPVSGTFTITINGDEIIDVDYDIPLIDSKNNTDQALGEAYALLASQIEESLKDAGYEIEVSYSSEANTFLFSWVDNGNQETLVFNFTDSNLESEAELVLDSETDGSGASGGSDTRGGSFASVDDVTIVAFGDIFIELYDIAGGNFTLSAGEDADIYLGYVKAASFDVTEVDGTSTFWFTDDNFGFGEIVIVGFTEGANGDVINFSDYGFVFNDFDADDDDFEFAEVEDGVLITFASTDTTEGYTGSILLAGLEIDDLVHANFVV
jgi:hypothetical protein